MAVNKARERYLAKVQQNKIVAQLNALRGAGKTTEEIQAAGTSAWQKLGGENIVHNSLTGEYTFKVNDTLPGIAAENGTTVPDILDANPELKYVKPGMVMNMPQRGRGFSGGLPSNAALGGATTNPLGTSSSIASGFNQIGNATPSNTPALGRSFSDFAGAGTFNPNQPIAAGGPQVISGGTPGRNFLSGISNALANYNPNAYATPLQGLIQSPFAPPPQPTVVNQQTAFAPTSRVKDDYYPTELAAILQITNQQPDPEQAAYLEKYGMGFYLDDTPGGGGGYGYGGGGGRGRGRGRGGGGGAAGGGAAGRGRSSAPAFASNAGFRGLVSWRL